MVVKFSKPSAYLKIYMYVVVLNVHYKYVVPVAAACFKCMVISTVPGFHDFTQVT